MADSVVHTHSAAPRPAAGSPKQTNQLNNEVSGVTSHPGEKESAVRRDRGKEGGTRGILPLVGLIDMKGVASLQLPGLGDLYDAASPNQALATHYPSALRDASSSTASHNTADVQPRTLTQMEATPPTQGHDSHQQYYVTLSSHQHKSEPVSFMAE